MRQTQRRAAESRQPPARSDDHSQEQNKGAKANKIKKYLGLGIDGAIQKHTERRGTKQRHCVKRGEKLSKDHREQQQQGYGEIHVEGLGARQKLRFSQARSIDKREEKRKDRHAIAFCDKRVTALVHFLGLRQVRALVPKARGCRHQTLAGMGLEPVYG